MSNQRSKYNVWHYAQKIFLPLCCICLFYSCIPHVLDLKFDEQEAILYDANGYHFRRLTIEKYDSNQCIVGIISYFMILGSNGDRRLHLLEKNDRYQLLDGSLTTSFEHGYFYRVEAYVLGASDTLSFWY